MRLCLYLLEIKGRGLPLEAVPAMNVLQPVDLIIQRLLLRVLDSPPSSTLLGHFFSNDFKSEIYEWLYMLNSKLRSLLILVAANCSNQITLTHADHPLTRFSRLGGPRVKPTQGSHALI